MPRQLRLRRLLRGPAPAPDTFQVYAAEDGLRLQTPDGTEAPFGAQQGPPGEKGPTGDKGPQGDSGEKGPDGDKGPQGDPGPDGQPGQNGLDGAPGAPGADGQPGPDGQPGADGLDGAVGDKGPPGDKGEVGDKGPIGDKGPDGDPGPDGAPGADGAAVLPVGSGFITFVNTNPASLLGYGTWEARGAGRVLVGADAGQSGGDLIGSATHGHDAHADHPALAHSGGGVGDHTFTPPTIANESAHTHTVAGVPQHTHVMTASNTAGTSGSNPTRGSGTQASVTAPNPSGSVAPPLPTSAGSAHSHGTTGGGVSAHSVQQANQHAVQSHSSHSSAAHLPLAIVVFLWERTA